MQARITAIAGIHRRLYTSSDVRVVELGAYLTSLIDELRPRSTRPTSATRWRCRPTPTSGVPTDKAVSIGVIVTELVTNAYKYAYPPGSARRDPRDRCAGAATAALTIAVEDDGVGWTRRRPPSAAPASARKW